MATVLAAGTLPWRRRRGRLQVALVHRPRYDDWSWAKGKLDPGETFPVAAARETLEETGLRVRLGHPLPTTTYTVASKSGPAVKEVRYWAAEVTGGDGGLVHEVDEVAWLEADAARATLTYPHDLAQLDALVAADAQGSLTTWPLAVLRHAKARPRASWTDDDWLRPLDDRGREQAADEEEHDLGAQPRPPHAGVAQGLEPQRLGPQRGRERHQHDDGRDRQQHLGQA